MIVTAERIAVPLILVSLSLNLFAHLIHYMQARGADVMAKGLQSFT
jgi:hypothetical protein